MKFERTSVLVNHLRLSLALLLKVCLLILKASADLDLKNSKVAEFSPGPTAETLKILL